jgi:hypothetical protein
LRALFDQIQTNRKSELEDGNARVI